MVAVEGHFLICVVKLDRLFGLSFNFKNDWRLRLRKDFFHFSKMRDYTFCQYVQITWFWNISFEPAAFFLVHKATIHKVFTN